MGAHSKRWRIPGSYLAIRRIWQDGDTVSVSLPMHLWTEPLPGDDSVSAALYGPMALAADLGPGPTDEAARPLYEPYPKIIPPPIPCREFPRKLKPIPPTGSKWNLPQNFASPLTAKAQS